MKAFLGRLFGTKKALEATIDGVSNGLDKLVYTNEEKAEDAARDRAEARKMVVSWMQATQGQNLSRRIIALSITSVWLFMYLISVFCNMLAVFIDKDGVITSEKFGAVAMLANAGADDMSPAVMLILAFYFAAPHMGSIATAALGKFGKKVEIDRVG